MAVTGLTRNQFIGFIAGTRVRIPPSPFFYSIKTAFRKNCEKPFFMLILISIGKTTVLLICRIFPTANKETNRGRHKIPKL